MGGYYRPGQPGGQQGGQTSQSSVSILSGDVVKVTDASGNVVVETTAYWDSINKYSATYVVCSTPNLTSGSSYSLYVNGTQKATASAQRTSGGYGVMSLGETAASNESAVALAAEVTTLTLNVTQAEKPEVVLTNKYTSEKPEIVAVSETGLVIGMEEGTALVTAVIYANDTAVLTQNYEITVEGKDVVVDDTDMPFEDVKANDYFYNSVLWAVENGITNGLTETMFGTGFSCTREQVVTFLWNLAGKPAANVTSCTFKDVDSNGYYYKAMLWAVENSIVSGYNADTFGVGDPCTREQIVSFLYRAFRQ